MLVSIIGMVLILQANLIASQVQVYTLQGYPLTVSEGSFSNRPLGFFPWQRDVFKVNNFSVSESNEGFQTINLMGNSSFSLSSSQNNLSLRSFLRNLFGFRQRQPSVQYLTIGGRAFSDSVQEPSYYRQYSSVVGPVLVPKANRKIVRRKVPRRVLVRNLKSNQALLTNVKTVKIPQFQSPIYDDEWQYATQYSERPETNY
ncbi:uncharacterized protein [Drosophila bipectinata]|uniref:uncharacterized protein n=1 Tax=Drosophila bipectinata TaxID=42026 RepID=UPI001C8AC753|nr:uncharacterized protein LOC122321291 [Drosophila bipectinata]